MASSLVFVVVAVGVGVGVGDELLQLFFKYFFNTCLVAPITLLFWLFNGSVFGGEHFSVWFGIVVVDVVIIVEFDDGWWWCCCSLFKKLFALLMPNWSWCEFVADAAIRSRPCLECNCSVPTLLLLLVLLLPLLLLVAYVVGRSFASISIVFVENVGECVSVICKKKRVIFTCMREFVCVCIRIAMHKSTPHSIHTRTHTYTNQIQINKWLCARCAV